MNIVFTPCACQIPIEDWNIYFKNKFVLNMNSTSKALHQINDQIGNLDLKCPFPSCGVRIISMYTSKLKNKKLSITDDILSIIIVPSISLDQIGINTSLHFKQIILKNIQNKGKNSDDSCDTYMRLSEIANDYPSLINAFGNTIGYLLYYTPTSWKAGVYIREMEKCKENNLPFISYVLVNDKEETVGTISIHKIDQEDYNLNDEYSSLNLYNIGVMLHSKFQREGIVSEISFSHLMYRIKNLSLDIDGFFIATKPSNVVIELLKN